VQLSVVEPGRINRRKVLAKHMRACKVRGKAPAIFPYELWETQRRGRGGKKRIGGPTEIKKGQDREGEQKSLLKQMGR